MRVKLLVGLDMNELNQVTTLYAGTRDETRCETCVQDMMSLDQGFKEACVCGWVERRAKGKG